MGIHRMPLGTITIAEGYHDAPRSPVVLQIVRSIHETVTQT